LWVCPHRYSVERVHQLAASLQETTLSNSASRVAEHSAMAMGFDVLLLLLLQVFMLSTNDILDRPTLKRILDR